LSRVGEIKKNSFGTEMQIIRYKDSADITVKFLDEFGFERDATYSNFKRGTIRNPYDRTVKEMGYFGVGEYRVQYPDDKTYTKEFVCWKNMLERCYQSKYAELHPAYYGICEVCDEWHNLQNFAKWHQENAYDCGDERLHLDKDIKYPGNGSNPKSEAAKRPPLSSSIGKSEIINTINSFPYFKLEKLSKKSNIVLIIISIHYLLIIISYI